MAEIARVRARTAEAATAALGTVMAHVREAGVIWSTSAAVERFPVTINGEDSGWTADDLRVIWDSDRVADLRAAIASGDPL